MVVSGNLDETVEALRGLRGALARRVLARAERRRSLSTQAERLTTAQHLALEALSDGPLSTSELAAGTGVAVSTATRMIQGLERAGLVAPVVVSAGDRRRRYVQMTSLGRATLGAADDELRMRIRAVLAPLTERERALLIDGMRILGAALGRVEVNDAEHVDARARPSSRDVGIVHGHDAR